MRLPRLFLAPISTTESRNTVVGRVLAFLRSIGVALAATALAFFLTQAIEPLSDRAPFLLFLAAVMVSGWYGGIIPALLACLLTLVAHLYVLHPAPVTSLSDPSYLVILVVFTLVAIAISSLTAARRRAAATAETLADDLAQRVAELQTLMDSAPVGIAIGTDPRGEHVTANRTLSQWLEMAPDSNISLSAPPEERTARYRVLSNGQDVPPDDLPIQYASLHNSSVRDVELEIIRQDGTRVELLAYAEPLRDVQGRVRGSVGTFVEITRRRRAERERDRLLVAEQTARAEAEAAVHVRDQFIALASHEFKTPLTAILGYAQLLVARVNEAGADAQQQRMARTILAQSERLNKMISALLDTTRIETGQLQIERAPVALAPLLEGIRQEAELSPRGHTFQFDLTAPDVVVNGDEARLRQMFDNLIQNAVKYSPGGGLVRVTLAGDDGKARIDVTDCGIGIPAEDQPRLFTRFFRASNADRQHIPGLGLGLSVVAEIVRLHDGEIRVVSREDRGTTFTVLLPTA